MAHILYMSTLFIMGLSTFNRPFIVWSSLMNLIPLFLCCTSFLKCIKWPSHAWRCIWCLTSKCNLWRPILFCWLNSENFPIDLDALKLTIGFRQRLAYLSPSWLVNKETSVSRHLAIIDLTNGTNQQPCGRHHEVYLTRTPMTTPTHQILHMMISRRFFLLKSGTLSLPQGRN